ncbi:glycoside hydrolase family 32 protein [Streptomyces ferrugineus]|uniref:beta-fructofuranosidase n=1 Tax=Streptomyces ferrugineus TaxID=1413221 RepID=A0A7M2SXF2_9ACTN|nr:glycoside hydrolase family 32 protein [Streptomyces ferrugineus]QOV40864.1 glycoside hydrolase family 32 protein [Streptomyces ferrugineus]
MTDMRQAVTLDSHFPAVHLRPPAHWINDPNGLVFHDGHYHVYFQYNPHSARHADMHWGHFRSPDLVRWEPMPVALAPTPGGHDEGGIWSGNAVSHDGRLTAFYSAHHPGRRHQPVTAAVSYDGGTTFSKHDRLLIPDAPEGTTMFRDPYVWRDGDRWRMLVGAALADGRGAALQYASDDLNDWSYQGIFLARPPHPLPGGRNTEAGWECAQYAAFPDGTGAVLASAWNPEEGASCAIYWPGRAQDGAFHAGSPRLLDHGPDFYAPALLRAPDGRWLMWAWVWEARDEERVGAPSTWTDEAGWAGMLSVPRELTPGSDGELIQQPARELLALRGERRIAAAGKASAEQPVVLGEVARATDLTLNLERGGRLRLLTSPDGTEYLDIVHHLVTGEVVVDRDHASLDSRAKRGSWRLPSEGSTTTLRILLDHSVAEIFTAAGRTLTLRFYPVGDGPWRVQMGATGRAEAAYTVGAWDLTPPGQREGRPTCA